MTTEREGRDSGLPWRTAAHLLGFGLLLALGILLVQGPPADRDNGGRLVFTAADVAQVSATFERTWNRPPTALERKRAFDRYVRDEVLYREAVAQGLDRDDPVVRMSLVRKITMLGTAQAELAEPSDEEVEAYFQLRQERYRVSAALSFLQVYLNRDRRGERTPEDAARLLADLRRQKPRLEELAALGDATMLPTSGADLSEEDLARTFGAEFRDAVVALDPGLWEGPVESAYGLHLVKVTRRSEPRIPNWSEIRDRVMNDLRFEARQAAEDQLYAEILPRYQLIYGDRVATALEGGHQGRAADTGAP